jgi:Xaa-Pro aminopeptidase
VDHPLRRAQLGERLQELDIEALLVTRSPNVGYLTGFTGSNGQVVVTPTSAVFFTDGRYVEQARHEVPDLDRVTYSWEFPKALAERFSGIETLGFEAHDVTVAAHGTYAEALDRVTLVPTDKVVERARWVKDDDELGILRAAQEATDQAFEEILDRVAIGVSERGLARGLEDAMRRAGADGLAFEPIVAFGEQAAEPHHEPRHRLLREGDVIKLDFGALVGGYHADMTRTIAFGAPSPELRKIHDVVRQAQEAGIDAVRAGVTGGEVDSAARSVIQGAGYGERFTHGLGHGVGLEIHEGPSLRREGTDVLPVGAVVTVEPGIYVPGLGGVRIEDSVEVTEHGCRVLGTATRELIEL